MNRWAPIELTASSFLFVDNDLVAVDKAPGVLCDATVDPSREHLGTALRRWAGDDTAEFLPAHRLDKGTSGVILFARNRATAQALMTQFQERSVSKQYQAVVRPPEQTPWVVGDSFERHSYLRHRRGQSEEVRSGGKPAQSRFEVIAIDHPVALIRALPGTGRTHQLRVHLAAMGAPIVGDERYGDSLPQHLGADAARLWLHAEALSFVHPATRQPLAIRSRSRFVLVNGSPAHA